jgi:integrase/recombinase XerD
VYDVKFVMNIQEAFHYYIDTVLKYKGLTLKTQSNYLGAYNSFRLLVGEMNICDITFEHINLWKSLMQEKPLKESSIASNIIRFRQVVDYFHKKGLCELSRDDISTPKVPTRRPDWLEPFEIREMINSCKCDRDRLLIALLFSTGCRIGELMGIDLKDIHGTYIVVHGKGDKYRPVFFDDTAKRYLDKYLETRSDGLPYLFTSVRNSRLTISTAQYVIKEASRTLGKNVYPHMLRHSYATNASAAGMPITMLKEILGHDNISTTMMYIHSNLRDRESAYNKYKVAY